MQNMLINDLQVYRIVHASIDIVVVLLMSTSWTPMPVRVVFNPEFRHYVSRESCPCGLTVVYKISQPLNLAS